MKKLPFSTTPKFTKVTIGNEEIGTCELPAFNGLIAGEQIAIEEISEKLADPFAEASRLAIKIRFEQKLQDKDTIFCFDIVANSGWEEQQRERLEAELKERKVSAKEAEKRKAELEEKVELFNRLRIEYSPQIKELNSKIQSSSRLKKFSTVTALLKFRGTTLLRDELKKLKQGFTPSGSEESLRIEELEDQIKTLEDWTDADTQQLHSSFVDAVWNFAQKEMNGGKDPEELTSEAVGKLPEALESEKESTGETYSGESEDIGLKTKDLALTTS